MPHKGHVSGQLGNDITLDMLPEVRDVIRGDVIKLDEKRDSFCDKIKSYFLYKCAAMDACFDFKHTFLREHP